MKVTFLGQGFEQESKNAVGNILHSQLEMMDYSSFFCLSAFASSSAVDLIGGIIESFPTRPRENYTIIIGVDQQGTSKEALRKLNQLGVNSYVFYQKEAPIFHPKVYLLEGEQATTLIIGSSNLTGAGLFNNVESSLMIEFSKPDKEGEEIVKQLKSYFSTLFDLTDPNLFKLDDKLINSLIDYGIVPTVQTWEKRYSKHTVGESIDKATDEFVIPKRKAARIPRALKGLYVTNKVVSELVTETEYDTGLDLLHDEEYMVLWSCSGLTRRDLNIPEGDRAHKTGSMTLRKGNMENIDQRHFFYEEVFSDLTWERNSKNPFSYSAPCKFRIVIKGIDYGVYTLFITHNTDINSATYKQNNAMSHLKWGEAIELVGQEELLQKSLYLLKNINTGEFAIEIK